MSAPLLATKLYFPPARRSIVARPRLITRLKAGLEGPFTLVSAPAGSGKTTLLSEWRAGAGRDMPAAWLSLDTGENDLARFLTYLTAALETLQAGLVANTQLLLQTPQLPPVEAILTTLINDISRQLADFALVLDDYHVIDTPAIHQALAFLLDHQPPQMHLVLLTRADPPLPLARLPVSSQLTEIRSEHLRFTLDETAVFLKEVMSLSLDVEHVAALKTRTEGWIAGLQLAGLSMQRLDPDNLESCIQTFAGSHHYIVDYLADEVLQRQPEGVLDFLLQTSILDRLNCSLCAAVVRPFERIPAEPSDPSIAAGLPEGIFERPNAKTCQRILEYLEHANLFLFPLDDHREWFRYHHLFADVLRRLLHESSPELEIELHLHAGRWYEQNGLPEEAIGHYLAAKDWPRAASLIERTSQSSMQCGEFDKIKYWMDALPKDILSTHPVLSINYGWATVFNGQFDEAEKIFQEIEPAIRVHPALQVSWLAARVWAARGRGEQAQAVDLALKALQMPGTGDPVSRCFLLMSLSLAYWHLGKLRETLETAEGAVCLAESAGEWHSYVIVKSRIALVKTAQGHLRQAEREYQETIRSRPGVPNWAGGGVAQLYLAALYYEWNELDRALEYAMLCLEYSRITGYAEFCVNGYRLLSYIYQAQGEPEKALEALEEAAQAAQKHGLPEILLGPTNASRIHIALAQGDLESAAYLQGRVQGGYGAAFHYLKLPLEQAKLALASGDLAGAAGLLKERYETAFQNGIGYAQIEIRTLQALAARREDQALAYLSEALEMAEPERFVRVFIDQGKGLIPLLEKAARFGLSPDYCSRLLSIFHAGSSPAQLPSSGGLPNRLLPEPLSRRELEILRLVAAGCSNEEIARELVIAIGTVKRHTSNIFGKLDAANRTQAAARARALGLL